jgi:hypothetical protein
MNTLRIPFLAVAVASLLAATAGAQTTLYNPIARSFHMEPVAAVELQPQSPTPFHAASIAENPARKVPAAEAEHTVPSRRPRRVRLAQRLDPLADAADEAVIDESPVERSADPVAPPEGGGESADTEEAEPETAAPAETGAPAETTSPAESDDPDTPNAESERSASDIPIPYEPELPEPGLMDPAAYPEGGKGCGKGCDGKGCGCGGLGTFGCFRCAPSKPWLLPQPCITRSAGIKIGGWIQQGITTNNNGPSDNYNAAVAINDRDGEWQVNQIWLYFTKPIKQRECCWQAGGHVDILYGSDWRYGRFFGLEERISGDDDFYGWVFPQMYVEVGGHNLSVKMGHMAGPLGYEIVPAVANFFYSHSYAISYTEPQLVTGLWADYKIGKHWTVQAGFHRGFFMFEDEDGNLDFMGGLQWASCDNKTSIRYALSSGNNRGLGLGQQWFASSLVLQHQFTQRFKYVLQHNLGTINDVNVGPIGDAEWYGLNQYFFYKISKCLEAGLRVEWLRDDDGVRVAGVGSAANPLMTQRGWAGGPGFAGNFWEITAGVNWSPHPNVRIRPEVRWDWYDGPDNLLIPAQPRPFDDFTGDDQFTAAFDVLIVF